MKYIKTKPKIYLDKVAELKNIIPEQIDVLKEITLKVNL